MVLWFYRLIFLPALLVLAPYYLWRMRRRGGYRDSFAQRFGSVPPEGREKKAGKKRIWLQAVSVGELLAIEPLLSALAAEADWEVYLTTTTSTGFRLARDRHRAKVSAVAYFPTDFWWFSARAWRQIEPDLAILTEGERWPEHIHQANRRGVPVLSINARLSDRSYRRMRSVRGMIPGLMGGIDRLLAVSAEDAQRFRDLGFAPDRIAVSGNLKVDHAIAEITTEAKLTLREQLGFGPHDLVVLGSSTWPGEEHSLLKAWEQAKEASGTDRVVRLLLVPRHAERKDEVERVVQGAGVSYHLRSRGHAPMPVEVAIADTTGELQRLTQLADVVFVGKSLAPHREGQTPIEAAGLGRAVILGSGMSSFRSIAKDLVEVGAARRVRDEVELAEALGALLADAAVRQQMGEAGAAWHQRNRGALGRTLRVIREVLESS